MRRGALLVLAFLLVGCVTAAELPKVERAIDGDTLELENGSKVRLNGINTPERGERLYGEAKRELQWLEGTPIRLERDVTSKDRYGRILSYVYSGGEMANLVLVEKGLAHVYRTENKMHQQELLAAEEAARRSSIGIWEPSPEQCVELSYFGYDARDELLVLENACPYEVNMSWWSVKDEATNQYDFPEFLLGPSMLVTLHSGKGVDNATHLYWNSTNVWNNDGDRLFLRDAEGLLAVFEEY